MSGSPDIGMYAPVSKDGAATIRASWFETRLTALLTMRRQRKSGSPLLRTIR